MPCNVHRGLCRAGQVGGGIRSDWHRREAKITKQQECDAAAAQGEPPLPVPDSSWLNREIRDEFALLEKRLDVINHSIAASVGLMPSDVLALSKLDKPLPMKELAQRMACDASFVTVVADTLEEHGLVRREPSRYDRRVKHLVLTPDGIAARQRLAQEFAVQMPWSTGLDDTELRGLLSLLRKMRRG
jgi:DNA-binding MarR family transcriptional regulator